MKYRTLIYDEERKETHITKQLVEEYFYPLCSATHIHCMSDPKKLLQSDCPYHLVIITIPVSKASLELLLMHLRGCNPYMYLLCIFYSSRMMQDCISWAICTEPETFYLSH